MRPQGLTRWRKWTEGDELDQPAVLDHVVDKRMGRTPTDRLYIKRIKHFRDVAVLLLTDLSRSTANFVQGESKTVLDVEKEALVLFCEALTVLGDDFALAGFSSSGRLWVDYQVIKRFDEPMNPGVMAKMGGLFPGKSTRMGGAIRHGARALANTGARARLLIVLTDGFPNDLDYKGEYAAADTRRAVSEARSMGIHTRGITVNMAQSGRLRAVWGGMRHSLVSDVRDLPDRLVNIYSRLTRY